MNPQARQSKGSIDRRDRFWRGRRGEVGGDNRGKDRTGRRSGDRLGRAWMR